MLPTWYTLYVKKIEEYLSLSLKEYFEGKGTSVIEEFKEIISYGSNCWKRLRSILALEFYLNYSKKSIEDISYQDDIWKLCIAIEIVHAFSLIHDDLPCMDNDELRRWQPTVWKKYWEYNAVLAGDMMNTFCFEILSNIKNPTYAQKIIKVLSHAIWIHGMVWGQIEDMYYEKNTWELTKEILVWIHNKKTGALIQASILSWLILAWAWEEEVKNFEWFWLDIGLAFQIKDDLLDVEWTPEETGKSTWGEEKWFVHIFWMEESKKELERLIQTCKQTIQELNSERLNFIVDFVAQRNK